MPGLIDAHIHLWGMKDNLLTSGIPVFEDSMIQAIRGVMDVWKLIDAGFTTVRNAGCIHAIHLRNAINEGSIIGPRILACGRSIGRTGGHVDLPHVPLEWWDSKRNSITRLADGVAEIRKAVREELRGGADFIKIMTSGCPRKDDDLTRAEMSPDEVRAVVDEARLAGVRTAAHAQCTAGVKNALLGGVDTVEHGFALDEECIDLFLKQKTYLITTLSIYYNFFTKGPGAGAQESAVNLARKWWEVNVESFKRAYRAGVKCGLATDCLGEPMFPMGDNALELELFVDQVGLTPLEAIVCATRNNAEALGLADKVGTLEPGKCADVLVIDGDPLEDITILRNKKNIVTVFKNGAEVPRLGPIGVRGING